MLQFFVSSFIRRSVLSFSAGSTSAICINVINLAFSRCADDVQSFVRNKSDKQAMEYLC